MYLRLKSKLFLRLSSIHACLPLQTCWYETSSSGFNWLQVRHSLFSSLSILWYKEWECESDILWQSYAHCFLKNLALLSPYSLSAVWYDFRCRGKTLRKTKNILLSILDHCLSVKNVICLTAPGDWKSGNIWEYFHKEIKVTLDSEG